MSEGENEARKRGEPLVGPNIDSKEKWGDFMRMVLRDFSLSVSRSRCEELEPISYENVPYSYPLAFLVGFYISLDPLGIELMILLKA